MSPNLESRVEIAPEIVYQKVGEETVFLNLHTGFYYGLDSVGSRFWELLSDQRAPMLSEVLEAITREYDAPTDRIQMDILELVENLHAKGLVTLPTEADS